MYMYFILIQKPDSYSFHGVIFSINPWMFQSHVRWVSALLAIAGFGDYCIIASRSEVDESQGKYNLGLYNTLGTPVDGRYMFQYDVNSLLFIAL